MTNLINAENSQAVVDAIDLVNLVCKISVVICVFVVAFPLGLGMSKKHERPAAIVTSVACIAASIFCTGALALDYIQNSYDVDVDVRALDDTSRVIIAVSLVLMLVSCVVTAVIAKRRNKMTPKES